LRLYGTMQIDAEGVLNIGDVSTIELVNKYGTPLLVLDEKEIRDNACKYTKSFSNYEQKTRIIYAGKAFLNLTLCRIIEEEGLGLDVVSGGELHIALKAGFPPEKK